MLDLALDWEKKINNLCVKYKVDTDHYNDNDEFKETIAKVLGFPSFASFQAFPNPRMIIGGMGNPITEDYLLFVPALLDDCCKEIKRRWFFDRDEKVLLNQTDALLIYILDNKLPTELAVAGIVNMTTKYDFPYDQTDAWFDVLKLYGNLV